jgi:hypothetical protein
VRDIVGVAVRGHPGHRAGFDQQTARTHPHDLDRSTSMPRLGTHPRGQPATGFRGEVSVSSDTQYDSDFCGTSDDEGVGRSTAGAELGSASAQAVCGAHNRATVSAPTADREGTGVFSPTRAEIPQRTLRTRPVGGSRRSIVDNRYRHLPIPRTCRAFLQNNYYVEAYHYHDALLTRRASAGGVPSQANFGSRR